MMKLDMAKHEDIDNWRRKKILFGLIILGTFFSSSVLSLQGPFLPFIAEGKGIPPSQYGFIFSVYSLTSLIASPVFGSLLTVIGLRKCLCFGLFTISLSTIAFGFIDILSSPTLFLGLALFLRILEAIGQTTFQTSSISIISQMYEKETSLKVSLSQTAFGVGLIVGPGVGGVLFDAGGFILPFGVVGGLLFICAITSVFLVQGIGGLNPKKEAPKNMWHVLLIPGVWVTLFGCFVANIATGFVISMLEPHLEQFNLTASQFGLIFVISPLLYTCSVPIWGKCLSHGVASRILFSGGFVFMILSFSFIGPLPIPDIEPTLPLVITGLILHGIGTGLLVTSGLMDLIRLGKKHCEDGEEAIVGLMTAFYVMTFSAGCFIAPSVGGILLEVIGFRLETLILVVMNALTLILIGIQSLWSQLTTDDEEGRPLLDIANIFQMYS